MIPCMNVELFYFYIHYMAFTLLNKIYDYNNSRYRGTVEFFNAKTFFLSQPCFDIFVSFTS